MDYNGQPPQLFYEPPPRALDSSDCDTNRSIETLAVVLAVITIVSVIAGIIARLCGGRHLLGTSGDHDIEGWVEKKCRSCLDGGLPPPPPPPPAEEPSKAPAAVEPEKK